MRNWFFAATVAVLAAIVGGCSHSDTIALPDLQGQHRVIATFTDDSSRTASLTNAFKSAPGLSTYDIVWFVVGPDKILSNTHNVPGRDKLEQLHTIDGFQAVLVGKNGKLQASQLGNLDIQSLLDTIDQLPGQ